MIFNLNEQLKSSCFDLGDWPLSRVLLKNNADFPWLILVPRMNNIEAMDQLPHSAQHQLMDEISHLSSIVRTYWHPDKLNVGALGNIVSQLHVHVVARFTTDGLWPHGVWQAAQNGRPYSEEELSPIVTSLRQLVLSACPSGNCL